MRNRSLIDAPFRPSPLKMNKKSFPYMRHEIPFPVDDCLGWLSAQKLYPKVYFETPEEGIIAGIGSAIQLDTFPHFEEEEGPSFFGGMDFMERKMGIWGEFPSCAYVLPLIELRQKNGRSFLIFNRLSEDIDLSLKEEVSLNDCSIFSTSSSDCPSYATWEKNVGALLKKIERGDFQKVVLARATTIPLEKKLSPYAILKSLKGKNRFAFQFSEKQAFIGNSPETLYRREKRKIKTHAIAGTHPRGKTPEEDILFRKKLLQSSKDQREIEIVKEMICSTLSPMCQSIKVDPCRVLQTSHLHHLHYNIEGILKEDISDKALIQALHPTPAVGGFPKEKVLPEIKNRESFDRGWYAAPVGFVSPNKAHHLVAIRSALVTDRHATFFAGTGLVSGSIPSKEWEELGYKMSQFNGAL